MMTEAFRVFRSGMFSALDERCATLRQRLDELEIDQRYKQLISDEWAANDCRLDGIDPSLLDRARENHRAATALLLSHPKSTPLDLDLLKTVHGVMTAGLSQEAGVFRRSEVAPLTINHEPSGSQFIEPAVANLLNWALADSFSELHPVQQMALMLVRLLDIYPFTDAAQRTCRVVANFYLICAGIPPAVFQASEAADYRAAVKAAFEMDTSKLTDLIAKAANRALDFCLSEGK